jgi:hypothetical protein
MCFYLKPKYWCWIMQKITSTTWIILCWNIQKKSFNLFHVNVILKNSLEKMLDSLFLFLEPKLWMNLSLKKNFQMSTIMHKLEQMLKFIRFVISFVYIVYVACLHLVQMFELVITTYIYWPIMCNLGSLFVKVFFELVVRIRCMYTGCWIHSKNICGVFELAIIKCMFIGQFNALQELHLWVCLSL